MKKILKYQLPTSPGVENILMPEGAKILCIQKQNNTPTIWALCDDANPLVNRRILVLMTGHQITFITIGEYIGTLQFDNGGFVLHYFDSRS